MLKLVALMALISITFACPDERYCQFCIDDAKKGICGLCYEGFVDPNSEKCTPIPTVSVVDQCAFYGVEPGEKDGKKACVTCKFGFGLSNNKCVPCQTENCAICEDPKVCTACKNSKKVEFADGKSTCTDKQTEMPNCLYAAYKGDNTPFKCEKCVDGYALNEDLGWKDNCQKSDIKNCWSFSGKTNKCINCDFGYYITKSGTCASNASMSIWGWLLLVVVLLIIAGIGYGIYQWVWNNNPNTVRVANQQPLIN